MATPKFKEMKRAYGFDEVAIVPGDVTINPEQTNVDLKVGDFTFTVPIMASAMDAVSDVKFAIAMGKLGGLAVLHLEGVQTRYKDYEGILEQIAHSDPKDVTPLLQKVYTEPIKDNLVGEIVQKVKKAGVICAVTSAPATAKRLAPLAVEAGADIYSVASTVTTARHTSKSVRGLIFPEFVKQIKVPVMVGNTVSYQATLDLMRTGVAAILIGVGPGSACTSREVLGIGVPQITATIDCAAARDTYQKESGRYVPIITDGGFRKGGDVCKAFAAGADGIMIGSIFAQAKESPGHGYHWGMSSQHASLPRGTRVKVGTTGTLEQILFGPSSLTNGSQNLVGALRTAMGVCGAANIREMHKAEMVIAPAITTEGKFYQITGSN